MTWEELETACKSCTECALHETRHNCVFGTGSTAATLMFVGEAPGEKEDLSGVPFVGAAGKLLDKYLEAVGIDRNSVYIANILKCRLLQQGRRSGIGAISGGIDTFLSKNKARDWDSKLSRMTKYFAIAFFVLAVVANVIALAVNAQ